MTGTVQRKAISKALLNVLASAYSWQTVGRVARVPQSVPPEAMPALYLLAIRENQEQTQAWGIPVYQRKYGALIYLRKDAVGGDENYVDQVDDLLDAIDYAMRQGPIVKGQPTLSSGQPQTLGNLVSNCWISGDIQIIGAPTSLGQFAVIPIPITTITGV